MPHEDWYGCRLHFLVVPRFYWPSATAAAVTAVVDPLRQCFISAAPLSESVPSDKTMGTALPTAASSVVLLNVRALSFGLIGLFERGGQRDLELLIVLGLLNSVATVALRTKKRNSRTLVVDADY